MRIDWRFLRLVLYCFAGIAVLIVFPLSGLTSGEIVASVVASGFTSLLHLLLGYVAIELGFDKPNTTFLKIVLGGTVVRLLFLVTTVVVLVRVYEFHALSLMISMLFFYVLNLTLEIRLLQKRVALKSQ